MITTNCSNTCQVLKCEQRFFTTKEGEQREYYQVNFVADGDFYQATATADAAQKITAVPANYLLQLALSNFRNRWKVKVTDAQRVAH